MIFHSRSKLARFSPAQFAAALALATLPWMASGQEFVEQRLQISDYHLDDHGVADVDGDGYLDIFTTNHNGQQFIEFGSGAGTFSTVDIEALGVSQNPDIPGLPDSNWKPDTVAEGIYVYSRRGDLFVKRVGLEALGDISGTIFHQSSRDVFVNGFTYERICDSGPIFRCHTNFVAKKPGQLRLDSSIYQNPKHISLDPRIPLDKIFLGSLNVNPDSHEIRLRLMDRHGMAWSDINNDGALDVYINSGGSHGLLQQLQAKYPEIEYRNELFCSSNGTYSPCIDGSGLIKETDRGRASAWVDFDRNGRLDLYVGNHESPNRLFKRRADGTFNDRAPALGLDTVDSGPFAWFDVDNDRDSDLLIAEKPDIVLYRRIPGGYAREVIGPYRGLYTTWGYGKMSLFDLTGDGYLDALLAGPKGSSLITNTDGTLTTRPVEEVGLPDNSFSLDFVDIDNDGTIEVHAVSRQCDGDGIYRTEDNLNFVRTESLSTLRDDFCSAARSFWFDADNDGFQDLLMSRVSMALSDRHWKTHLYSNGGTDNHWLQVKLQGPDGNRQAIGARVLVVAGGRAYTQQVGQFDGSRYSQGHYRMYFGLGSAATIKRLKVFWPDGGNTLLFDPEPDQLLTISHPGPSP